MSKASKTNKSNVTIRSDIGTVHTTTVHCDLCGEYFTMEFDKWEEKIKSENPKFLCSNEKCINNRKSESRE